MAAPMDEKSAMNCIEPNSGENATAEAGKLYERFSIAMESKFLPKTAPTIEDRYFTARYKPDVKDAQSEDLKILCHSNKLCIVTLSQFHPILAADKTIEKVDFQVTKNTNLLNNKVVGKRKKGGQWMTADSKLCMITCTDGSCYTVYSCINGRLVEVNENLATNPALIKQPTHACGYIAVIFPRLENYDQQMSKLTSADDYRRIVNERVNMAASQPEPVEKLDDETTTTSGAVIDGENTDEAPPTSVEMTTRNTNGVPANHIQNDLAAT
ncbi:protein Abitram-like [Tubulanus polymorphus]|uniref:protein Abitram-like n=1 Tax=Tubulanus polymorphus TaxID=672921 RepID=UPI003DA5F211